MNILAVDPGGTTGWAAITPTGEFRSGQVRDWIAWLDHVYVTSKHASWNVVIEKYTITPETLRKTRQYDALEIIGALRWMTRSVGGTYTLQTPADAKSFATDKKLQKVGWYVRGQGHANDAARHLMLYLVRTHPGMILPLLEGDE